MPPKTYQPPRPAPLPADYEEFYASLTDAEKELDKMAQEMLGSSYFIQWTHMYRKWSKAKAAADAAAKAESKAAAAAEAASKPQ